MLAEHLRDDLFRIKQCEAHTAALQHFFEFAQAVPLQVAAEVAVKIVDDRGIESLKVISLD